MLTFCMNQETILASVKNVKFNCYVEPLIVYCAIFSLFVCWIALFGWWCNCPTHRLAQLEHK